MSTKHYYIVTYLEGLLKSHGFLTTWYCEIKVNTYLLSQYLWSLNLASWSHTMKNPHSKRYMDLQSRGFVRHVTH